VWSVKTLQLDTLLSLAPPVDDWIKTGCCTRRETPKGFDPLRLMPESRQALYTALEGKALGITFLAKDGEDLCLGDTRTQECSVCNEVANTKSYLPDGKIGVDA
jgi:hypothetical protein